MKKLVANFSVAFSLLILVVPVQLLSIRHHRSKREASSFQTTIILGNQYTSRAEIYELTFNCTNDGCKPLPLEEADLVWSSPDTPGISEVKHVRYLGQRAILATTQNGAIVYSYPNGTKLFHKELDTTKWINVHSAEVLPDGNVVVAGSISDGIFAILYRDGDNVTQLAAQTVSAYAPFGHSLVYDKARNKLYAAGYLTFLVLEYKSTSDGRGALKVAKKLSLTHLYDEENKNEDANYEDGVHDLYPVDGSTDKLYLTTGEHVYVLNVQVTC